MAWTKDPVYDPCPFCGTDIGMTASLVLGDRGRSVECSKCYARGPTHNGALARKHERDLWNTRAPKPAGPPFAGGFEQTITPGPCRFCGVQPTLSIEQGRNGKFRYTCFTADCGARGPGRATMREAYDAWASAMEAP